MKAGRELDALIAEKVTKIFVCDEWQLFQTTMDGGDWLKNCEHENCLPNIPYYSARIADAWLVVKKLREQRIGFHMHDGIVLDNETVWGVLFGGPDGNGNAQANTAPLAICLAALKAIE